MGYIMWPIYLLLQNFGWAILIFIIIVKLAMLPLTIKQQKNMAYSQLFMPQVNEIRRKYANNRDKQAEELQKLQAQGYNPTGGCGPLLLTMVLLFGVIDVVYKPMTHMEHMSGSDISSVVQIATETEYAKIFLNEYNEQDRLLIDKYKNESTKNELFKAEGEDRAQLVHQFKDDEGYKNDYSAKDPATISKEEREKYGSFTQEQLADLVSDNSRLTNETKNRLAEVAGKFVSLRNELTALQVYNQYPACFEESSLIGDGVKDQLANLSKNMVFYGLDLGQTPRWAFEPLVIIPIFSFLFSVAQLGISQYFNKKNNPDMPGNGSMTAMLIIMPIFSLWISFTVPAGVGFYWGISYLFGIIQSFIMQKFFNPAKLREEAKEKMKKNKAKVEVTATAVVTDAETGEEKVVTKTESLSQKEINRRKLTAARKADAEKYGEEYIEDDD